MPLDRNYALVYRGALALPDVTEEENGALPRATPAAPTCSTGSRSLTDNLASIYQDYATLYPNPALQSEYQQRDHLLEAVAAASHAVTLNPNTPGNERAAKAQSEASSSSSSSSWWSKVFRSSDKKGQIQKKSTAVRAAAVDDERLEYHSMPTAGGDDDALCGTRHSLDSSCIPAEAHALARWQWASSLATESSSSSLEPRTSSANNGGASRAVILAAASWERACPCTTITMIHGLGQIIEYQERDGDGAGEPQEGVTDSSSSSSSSMSRMHLLSTNDQHELHVCGAHQQASQPQRPWHVGQARAVTVGPNCMAVSWGLAATDPGSKVLNTNVILYRRNNVDVQDKANGIAPSWQAVARIGPTRATTDQLLDVFDEETDDEGNSLSSGSNPLLRVTGLTSLVYETDGIPAWTLVVSRLGGMLEFVPIPSIVWYGPALDIPVPPSGSFLKKNKRNRRTPGGGGPSSMLPSVNHARLPDLATSQLACCVSTVDYHVDILCVQSFRVQQEEDAETAYRPEQQEQDALLYPNSPRADFVVASCGTRDGRETVTFWNVGFLFEDPASIGDGRDFGLSLGLSEALDLGPSGPDKTIFANPTIMQHWRKPRTVELKNPNVMDESSSSSGEDDEVRVTTISVSAPTVSIQFAVIGGWAQAALMDANGGITLLDCSLLEQNAAHRLPEDARKAIYEVTEENAPVVPLVQLMRPRSLTQALLCKSDRDVSSSSCSLLRGTVQSLAWFLPHGDDANLRLLSLTNSPTALHVASFGDTNTCPFDVKLPKLETASLFCVEWTGKIYYVGFGSLSGKCSLYVSALKELRASEIVESLIRQSKYQEAVDAYKLLSQSDQEVLASTIENCKLLLWKKTLDLDVLRSLKDVPNIVGAAMEVESLPEEVLNATALSHFRSLHLIALESVPRARLGEVLSLGGAEGTRGVSDALQDRLIKLGTYELLCRHYSTTPSLPHFCSAFLATPIVELAIACAQSSDFRALSIITFRHRAETRKSFRIIESIPLTVDPRLYCHLLPSVDSWVTEDVGRFQTGLSNDPFHDWSQMPNYLRDRFDVIVTVSPEDERLVLSKGSTREGPEQNGSTNVVREASLLADHFSERLAAMNLFCRNFMQTTEFSRYAVLALSAPAGNGIASSPEASGLSKSAKMADALATLYLGRMGQGAFPSDTMALSLEDASNFTLADVVHHFFEGSDRDFTLLYNNFVVSILESEEDKSKLKTEQDVCDQSLALLSIVSPGDDVRTVSELLMSLKWCTCLTEASSVEISAPHRPIKDWNMLTSFALSVYKTVSTVCVDTPMSFDNCRCILDCLWRIYGSLPSTVPSGDDSRSETFLHQVDEAYESLVVADIVSGWPQNDSFVLHLGKSIPTGRSVSLMCKSFCLQVESLGGNDSNCKKLLSVLISDLDQMSKVLTNSTKEIKGALSNSLLKPLLLQNQVVLLGEVIAQTRDDWIDRSYLRHEVSLFLLDAAARGGALLPAAMAFGDVISRSLPELTQEFDSMKQCLDVAHFINSVLRIPNGILPKEVKESYPIDVLDRVLSECPVDVILVDCKSWADPVWAKGANKAIRDHFTRESKLQKGATKHKTQILPPLPGGAIFHLAEILGLVTAEEVLVVKSRVVLRGTKGKLYGASAAVCRSMIDKLSSPGTMNDIVVNSVSAVVSSPEFEDVDTKEELALMLRIRLEVRGSATSQVPLPRRAIQQENGLHPNALARFRNFYSSTLKQYGSDPSMMITSLGQQILVGAIDSTVVEALARFAVFWFIGESTKPKAQVSEEVVTWESRYILEFGLGLLFLLDETTKTQQILELEEVLSSQLAALGSSPNIALPLMGSEKPDEDIVKRLMGRGYSANGAKKAVLNSGNCSFDHALQWAVSNSFDESFDKAIARVLPVGIPFIQTSEIDLIKSALTKISEADKRAIYSISRLTKASPAASNGHGTGPSALPLETNGTRHFDVRLNSSPAETEVETKLEDAHRRSSLDPFKDDLLIEKHANGFDATIVSGNKSLPTAAYRLQKLGVIPPKMDRRTEQATNLLDVGSTEAPPAPMSANKAQKAGTTSSTLRGGLSTEPKKLIVPSVQPATRPKKLIVPSLQPASKPKKLIVSSPLPGIKAKKTPVASTRAPPTVSLPLTPAGTNIKPKPPPPQPSQPTPPPTAPKIQIPTPPHPPPPQKNAVSSILRIDTTAAVESPDRSALRARGQATYRSLRNSSSPGRRERLRLMEGGRRLLNKARVESSSSTPVSSANLNHIRSVATNIAAKAPTTSVHRYPLRSRTSQISTGSPIVSALLVSQPPPPPTQVVSSENDEDDTEDAGESGWDFDEADL